MTEKKFITESRFLEAQRNRFESAVELINNAIKDKRPILVRHHNDCDGYAGGINIERVLLKKLRAFHRRETDVYYYYKRLPSKAPYYDYQDAIKDLAGFLGNLDRFGRKMPLIIVIDNGSSEQDLLSLRRLKQYDAEILVIDHHPFSDEVDDIVDVHINPMMVEGYVYQLSAGMLSAELSHFLDENETEEELNQKILVAALSGIADKIRGEELDIYLKKALDKGFDEERLKDIGNAIDFEAHNIGFMEARNIVDDLFFGNIDLMNNAVTLLNDEVEKNKEAIRRIAVEKLEVKEKNRIVLGKIDVDKWEIARNFPPRGKYAGVSMKFLAEKYPSKQIVLIAYGEDYMTFRGTEASGFDLHKLIPVLKEKLPYATIGGGGHSLAGTINFQKGLFVEISNIVEDYFNDF